MNVYITGGNGLIGSAIAKVLSKKFKIVSIDIEEPNNIIKGVEYRLMDLSNPILSNFKIQESDVIIHCAAKIPLYNNSIQAIEENVIIDKNIIELVLNTNSYLIFFSSTIVYGYNESELNISEGNKLFPFDVYSNNKIRSENRIQENHNNSLILRINAPYGTYMRNETVLLKFVRKAIQNKPLFYHGSGNRMQDFTNVDDIATLISNIITQGKYPTGTYNISSGNPISMLNLAKKIVELSNSNSEIIASGQNDPQESYKASFNISKAISELNWEPKISLEQGLINVINYNRQ